MNFTEREFCTVTDKLERYASQIGTLQAHLDTEKKLNGMMATLGDKEREILTLRHELAMESSRRQQSEEAVRAMEMEVQGLKRECGFWKGECEKLKSVITSAAVENAFLKNCIMLSVSSIRQFLHFVKHINSKALIHTFLVKTVSPDMGPEALEVINQAVDLEETAEGKLADQIIIDNSGVIEHR